MLLRLRLLFGLLEWRVCRMRLLQLLCERHCRGVTGAVMVAMALESGRLLQGVNLLLQHQDLLLLRRLQVHGRKAATTAAVQSRRRVRRGLVRRARIGRWETGDRRLEREARHVQTRGSVRGHLPSDYAAPRGGRSGRKRSRRRCGGGCI